MRDEMMVQETYDFFVLLRQMSHEMPSFIRLSPGLQLAIRYAIGDVGEPEAGAEDEDDEEEAVETDSDPEEVDPGSDEDDEDGHGAVHRGRAKRPRYVPPSTRRNPRGGGAAPQRPAKRGRVRRAEASDSE